jgi:hypothetical protein
VSAPGSSCHPAALASNRTRVVHTALTLYKSHTQFPVCTSEKRPPGDSKRAFGSDITQGTNVLHDGLAEVPVLRIARKHIIVPGVHASHVHTVLAPVPQGGSGATCLESGGIVVLAARYIMQMWDQGVGAGSHQCWIVHPDNQPLQHPQKCNWAQYAHSSLRARIG